MLLASLLRVLLQGPAYVQHQHHGNQQYLHLVFMISQEIHDAVIAAGVPERLTASKGANLLPLSPTAQQQLARATAGTLSSAQSTITLHATGSDQVQDRGPPGATAFAGLTGPGGADFEAARKKRMSNEVSAGSSSWLGSRLMTKTLYGTQAHSSSCD